MDNQETVLLKDTYDNRNSSGHSAHLRIFLNDFLNATLLGEVQHRLAQWEETSHSEKPKTSKLPRKTSGVTHGWKTNVVFSFLSRHFGPLNTQLRVTFWLIWQFGVWPSICLPFTGSTASEVKTGKKWWASHRPRPQTHIYVMIFYLIR